jgi:hypothetical protein
LTFTDEKEKGRRRKSEYHTENEAIQKKPSSTKHTDAPEIGLALRMAYQQTINEDIPPEMLDLLGKLS